MNQLSTRMEKGFCEIREQYFKLTGLVEEQNARNIFVLDGLTNLFDRQERLEKDFAKIKEDRGIF